MSAVAPADDDVEEILSDEIDDERLADSVPENSSGEEFSWLTVVDT